MPRPLLNSGEQLKISQNNKLSTTAVHNSNTQNTEIDKMKLSRLLRQPRSREYMESMHKLDAGGHVHNQKQTEQIIQIIQNEFPAVEIKSILLGIVSICYLGKPYEVHTLDTIGGIVEHYKAGQTLPGGLEKARSIAIRGGYDFIEVYIDCCRAVSSSGAISVISV